MAGFLKFWSRFVAILTQILKLIGYTKGDNNNDDDNLNEEQTP